MSKDDRFLAKQNEEQAERIKELEAQLAKNKVTSQNIPLNIIALTDNQTVQKYKFKREKFILPGFGKVRAEDVIENYETNETSQEILNELIARKSSVLEYLGDEDAQEVDSSEEEGGEE